MTYQSKRKDERTLLCCLLGLDGQGPYANSRLIKKSNSSARFKHYKKELGERSEQENQRSS